MSLNNLKIDLNGIKSFLRNGFFVFLLFSAIFLFHTPAAYATDDSYKPQNFTIRGKVPLSPQFAYAMSKNSQAESNTFSPSINDMVSIKLHLLGANDTPLPNQTVAMRMSDLAKQKMYEEVIKTDETGIAVFYFRVTENMSGRMHIEFINRTYDQEILLKTTLSFDVANSKNAYKEWTIDIHEQVSSLISIETFSFMEKISYTEIVNTLFIPVDVINEKNNSSTTDHIDYPARAGPLLIS